MFTGIISDVGTIVAVEARGDPRLRIGCGYDMGGVDLGASIACAGICLTVVDKGPDWFAVDLSSETRGRTAAGLWEQGRPVNLERALRVGDELGGHIVTGHVDGVGEVVAATPDGGSQQLCIRASATLARFLAEKGSLAVNGVSLTVNRVETEGDAVVLSLTLVPHTLRSTAPLAAGDRVNLEVDLIARYLDRLLATRGNPMPVYPPSTSTD